jgi:DNA polymerase-3 subunit epsilon
MYLFFDTETTGLPGNWKAPITDTANWPRLVQLAWLLFDKNGTLQDSKDYIIAPKGYTIPSAASRIHGITTEIANSRGIDLMLVLDHFSRLVSNSECLVAHNMSFDEKIVGCEYLRNKLQNPVASRKKICTMEASTEFVGIRGNYGYKWPKLSELHYKLFGTGFDEAHNAAVDIRATAKCFWEMKKLGVLKGLKA